MILVPELIFRPGTNFQQSVVETAQKLSSDPGPIFQQSAVETAQKRLNRQKTDLKRHVVDNTLDFYASYAQI
jgi:hypothetical protein